MIKKFNIYTESIYSMASRIASPQFSKPVTNNEYKVLSVRILFPDSTEMSFPIVNESYFSNTQNYRINNTIDISDVDRLNSVLTKLYIDIFGNTIQMENYEEFVFVRCWNNEADFVENDWEGYIFNDKGESNFFEINMKFSTTSFNKNSYNFFRNKYINKNTLLRILSVYKNECPNGINYKEFMNLKNKFESYLLNIDETNDVNLVQTRIDNKSLLSLLYCLHLRDNSIFQNFDINEYININAPSKKLLDTLFK